ncbi:MAG: U32 family peptidase, partial [Moraxellaceae bacterium]
NFPAMPLHLSVQANTMNWAAVKFWQSIGIERVILSRELSINEIAEIKQRAPQMQLEVFVHGALCMAYSGRCLISSYVNKRDANQGACTNACRWNYQTHSAVQEDQNLIPVQTYTPTSQSLFVEQAEHPGELFALEEDEHGSYLFNSKDLRAVEQVEKLIAVGVDSLKIEGRTKSPYYVARTAQVYRRAIDDACAGKLFNTELLSELDGLANRGYTAGFLQRHTPLSLQNYQQGTSVGESQQLVGDILQQLNPTTLLVDVKNRFTCSDNLLLLTPAGNYRFVPQQITNKHGQSIAVAKGSGHIVSLHLPLELNATDAMLVKIHGGE